MTPVRAIVSILGVVIVVIVVVIGFKVFYRPTANATNDVAAALQELPKKKPVAPRGKVLATTGRSCDSSNREPYACPITSASPKGWCICGD